MVARSKGSAWLSRALWGVVLSLYVAWALRFIASSAVETPDGRYFCLFDDAMVSLRYAWNFAHGQGLVWNPGERVEGITSFLHTVCMSLGALVLGKSGTALFVQCVGLLLVLGTALMAAALGRELDRARPVALASVAAVLWYYPLSYWSLMGMETGLLALLSLGALVFALRAGAEPRGRFLLGLLLGLMFATRPDAIVPGLVILGFRAAWVGLSARRLRALVPWLVEGAGFAAVVGALTAFRWFYFDSPLPNTYALKVAGWPLGPRLENGLRFVLPFLETSRYLILLAVCSLSLQRDRRRLLVFGFAASVIACQIWVGGDAWAYFRLLVPAVMAFIVLAVDGAQALVRRVLRTERQWLISGLSVAAVAGSLWVADEPFASELRMEVPPYMVQLNRSTVSAGLELARYAEPEASVAVAAAGALPYYSGLRGVDVLGKSDRHVARLRGRGVDGETVTPGHNKFDLRYSIIELRPDVIYDALAWARYGGGDVFAFVQRNYVQSGAFWFRRGSPLVRWGRLPAAGGDAP
jgi:arabinofuranosyltransferase